MSTSRDDFSPIRTYLNWGTLGTSMKRSTLGLLVPEHPKSRSEKQRGTARPRREASLAGSGSARALPGGTHALWQARCSSGALRLSKPQAGGLNDYAGGTWNTPGTQLRRHSPHPPPSSSTPVASDLTPALQPHQPSKHTMGPVPPGNGLLGAQHSCHGPLPGHRPIWGSPTPHVVASASHE